MWRDVQMAWTDAVNQIKQRWPETDATYLTGIKGDRHLFVGHLADRHDLTLTEAAEAVQDWLWERALAQCSHPEDRRVIVAE